MNSLDIAQAYCARFNLRWADDVSEWEEDTGPAKGGGYVEGSTMHESPTIYVIGSGDEMFAEDTIMITSSDGTGPFEREEVLAAIGAGTPLHDE